MPQRQRGRGGWGTDWTKEEGGRGTGKEYVGYKGSKGDIRSSFPIILYTLTSVCIFSILFSIHFLGCCQEEFVERSRASLVADHFLYSHDLNV